MNGIWLALLAGLATGLGALLVFFFKGRSNRLISLALGFAAGVMLGVCFYDLLPHADEHLLEAVNATAASWAKILFLTLGIAAAALLDRLLPHQPNLAECGHEAAPDLLRLGRATMLAMLLHNLPEGMAIYLAAAENAETGLAMALAIALHNLPVGITIALPIYYATNSRRRALAATLLTGLAEPVGALLALLFLGPLLDGLFLGAIFAFISGVLLFIVLAELLPSARQFGHPSAALYAALAGIVLMPLIHLLGGHAH